MRVGRRSAGVAAGVWAVLYWVVVSAPDFVKAHVALTYPPARMYDLDFLDNLRTPPPCGMPKGEKRTTLMAGSTFNVTWHLAYLHQGGYKLELLNDQGKRWMDLTPITGNNDYVQVDPTTQQHLVRLPRNLSCLGCVIRLKREATEWGNNYTLWSCADVDIVQAKEYNEDCLGRGELRNGACKCKKLFSGSRCQFRDECWDDADCGANGKCFDIDATSYPRKQCYCQMGWFGQKCSKESSVKSVELKNHSTKKLSDNFTLHWKILPELEELEVVMIVKTLDYVSVGWRPKRITSACKAFPSIDEHAEADESEIVGIAEPQPDTSPELKHGQLIEDNPDIKHINVDKELPLTSSLPSLESFKPHKGNVTEVTLSEDPVAHGAAEPILEEARSDERHASDNTPTSSAFSTASPVEDVITHPTLLAEETVAESNGHPVTVEMEHEKEDVVRGHVEEVKNEDFGGAETAHDGEVNYGFGHEEGQVEYSLNVHTTTAEPRKRRLKRQAKNFVGNSSNVTGPSAMTSESTSEVNATVHRSPKARIYDDEQNGNAEPYADSDAARTFSLGKYTPKLEFHAMDCTDIVTGVARGTFSRVLDQYTRDRSTPRSDVFWGGEDSLTLATGFEKDGLTTIIFRRRLKALEGTDHDIVKGDMHVIWATGQSEGSFVRVPPSGLEAGKTKTPGFYRKGEFKYHGHRSQRGVASIDFFGDASNDKIQSNAHGEFKLPKSCTVDDCQYRATWEFIPSMDEVIFTVSTNNTDKWTGIGFSKDTKMPGTDAILGWVDESGRTFVMDTWIEGYGPPTLDMNQDVLSMTGSKVNGRVTLMFKRKRDTGDTQQDLPFTDTSCLYMIFPHDGGVFNAVNKKIRQHASPPIVSESRICIEGSTSSSGVLDKSSVLQPKVLEVSSSPIPPRVSSTPQSFRSVYLVAIRLPNQTLDDAIERGIDFKMLIIEHLKTAMTNALIRVGGFEKVDVTGLESEKNESRVVAKLQVFIDPSIGNHQLSPHYNDDKVEELVTVLNKTIASGQVGKLLVDPSYLVVEPPMEATRVDEDENAVDRSAEEMLKRKDRIMIYYVIIAAVGAMGLLLIVLIICTCCRSYAAKKAQVKKERLIAGAGWKDYAATGTHTYGYENFVSADDTPKIHKHTSGSNGTSRSGDHLYSSNGHSRGGGGLHGNSETRSLNRNQKAVGGSNDRNHYSRRSESLPRPNAATGSHDRGSRPSSAASLHPQGQLQPDFYFMPSQRRYSGEVVRVYVDYNNPNYVGK